MREFIGLPLDLAISKAHDCGFATTCKVCDSDKQKNWDVEIVVQAKLNGNNLYIVSSKFLTNKE